MWQLPFAAGQKLLTIAILQTQAGGTGKVSCIEQTQTAQFKYEKHQELY